MREMIRFQMAYSWMFGVSLNKAKKVYKKMKEKQYQRYIDKVIKAYERACKLAFYAD